MFLVPSALGDSSDALGKGGCYAESMAVSASQRLFTPGQYLEFEEQASERHEYVDGVVHALPGETREHNEVAGNLYTLLRPCARGSRCWVAFEGIKLWIPELNRYYYPDVMVLCDPRDADSKVFRYPCFIAEILSPATEATDRREKLQAYRSIETLNAYLMVDVTARAVDCLERPPGDWRLRHLTDGEVQVACLGAKLEIKAMVEGLGASV